MKKDSIFVREFGDTGKKGGYKKGGGEGGRWKGEEGRFG